MPFSCKVFRVDIKMIHLCRETLLFLCTNKQDRAKRQRFFSWLVLLTATQRNIQNTDTWNQCFQCKTLLLPICSTTFIILKKLYYIWWYMTIEKQAECILQLSHNISHTIFNHSIKNSNITTAWHTPARIKYPLFIP